MNEWAREMEQAVLTPATIKADNSVRLQQRINAMDVKANTSFSMKIPRAWLDKINPDDLNDPLLRQVLPIAEENETAHGFDENPTRDIETSPIGGVIRKYRDRALLLVTGACAIHCRYCFRRHFPYGKHAKKSHIQAAIDYIAKTPDISEVILSGGDPLTLSNERLFDICAHLDAITHVKRIRIHTRVPVVVPSRLDDELIDWLNARAQNCVLVLHINHAREIDTNLGNALSKLKTTVFNQSVLLKGVNDTCDALCELSLACFEIGVVPYYLHLLDKVSGAAHFEVSDGRATALHSEMRKRLPGYLVPRMVREDKETAEKKLFT